MQVRWNYKLKPNIEQVALMAEWLVTLRKHRNYCLRERENGWNDNNRASDQPINYAHGSYCDIDTRSEWGSYSPLTCPVVKHGVTSAELTKFSTNVLKWGNASDIQMKRTTQLRHENPYYSRIDSDVLQRNIAAQCSGGSTPPGNMRRLDAAFQGFWKDGRGFPKYARFATFKSFEYKPKRCKFEVNRVPGTKHRYSRVYLPGIGWMRYNESRPIQEFASARTVTIKKEADGWYMSVLLNLPEELPEVTPLEDIAFPELVRYT